MNSINDFLNFIYQMPTKYTNQEKLKKLRAMYDIFSAGLLPYGYCTQTEFNIMFMDRSMLELAYALEIVYPPTVTFYSVPG